MGLSNSERYARMVLAVNNMTCQIGQLPEGRVRDLAGKLWGALRRPHRNTIYWILGDGIDSNILKGDTLFDVVLLQHGEELRAQIDGTSELFAFTPDPVRSWFELDALFGKFTTDLSGVLMIFRHAENALYALNRYDDEMRREYRELEDLIASIQGECFSIFCENPEVLRAWLLSRIVDRILPESSQDDEVYKFWTSRGLHHYVPLGPGRDDDPPTSRLFEIFKHIQFRDPEITERVTISIEIAGPGWIPKNFKAADAFKSPVDLQAIDEAVANRVKNAKARAPEPGGTEFEFCWLTRQSNEITPAGGATATTAQTQKTPPKRKTQKTPPKRKTS